MYALKVSDNEKTGRVDNVGKIFYKIWIFGKKTAKNA